MKISKLSKREYLVENIDNGHKDIFGECIDPSEAARMACEEWNEIEDFESVDEIRDEVYEVTDCRGVITTFTAESNLEVIHYIEQTH